MAHLSDMPEKQRNLIVNQDLPDYGDTPCAEGPALPERKIAIITTAGLHLREDKAFTPGIGEYRIRILGPSRRYVADGISFWP